MKFGLAHRIAINSLATIGIITVFACGMLKPAAIIALSVGLVAALIVSERQQQSKFYTRLVIALPIAWLVVDMVRFAMGASVLEIALEYAAVLQVIRLATRQGASHDQQIILLALLHLISGSVLGGGLVFAFSLLVFSILAPPTLVLSHLRREVEGNYRQGARDRTGLPVDVPRILRSRRVVGPSLLAFATLLSLPSLVFAITLFLFFPRVNLAWMPFGGRGNTRLIGFSDKVDLREVGTLRTNPLVALRFRVPGLVNPPDHLILRLRGTAFDTFHTDGHWDRTSAPTLPIPRSDNKFILRQPTANALTLSIEQEALEPPVLFLPIGTSTVTMLGPKRGSLFFGAEETIRYEGGTDRAIQYDITYAPDSLDDRVLRDRARYLELPPTTPARIHELAAQWTLNLTDDFQKAEAIEHHLSTEYRYSLSSPSSGAPDPISHFLFQSRAGHCEFFSSSMSVMLRTIGIPSRNVTGFIGGAFNRFGGFYTVRQGDAHSWVEAYVNGHWVTFDPTPKEGAQPAARDGIGNWFADLIEAVAQRWERYVVGYDQPLQLGVYRTAQMVLTSEWAKRIGLAIGGIIALGLLIRYGRNLRFRWQQKASRGPSPPRHRAPLAEINRARAIERLLASLGFVRSHHVPLLAFVESLHDKVSVPFFEQLEPLVHTYLRTRFGEHKLSQVEESAFGASLRQLASMRAHGQALRSLH